MNSSMSSATRTEHTPGEPVADSATGRPGAGPIVRVLGVRHHGPGSARAVVAALEALHPDVILVEGPADADPLAALAASDEMVPPVALLGYAVDQPNVSAFWPMAAFSPEWQAIAWGARRGVRVGFCDLPAANVLAAREQGEPDLFGADTGTDTGTDTGADAGTRTGIGTDTDTGAPGDSEADSAIDSETGAEVDGDGEASLPADPAVVLRTDPIGVLAQSAGYDDPERWWDDLIESRSEQDVFDVITEAMAELRRGGPGYAAASLDPTEAHREAHMRQVIRAAVKGGAQRIAVVCGAWHAPALTWPLPPAAPDARLLRGLPKRKVALTWVPWTHSRLSYASGYGAGIASPGWYAHLFSSRDRPIADWLTRVAGLLRTRDYPISSAHVIEAVRLAETLAVMRGRPLAGLTEVNDATRAVICDGNDSLLGTVVSDLVVGEAIGEVPADTPTVPLESDLIATTRRLRLKRDPVLSSKDLDLRKPGDVERSALLHRLTLLGIGWGRPAASAVRSTGTFRESWQLAWQPEFSVDVIEASMWGTTVESAATNKVISDALGADLAGLTGLVETCLLANLADALPDLLSALDMRAARDHDITELMRALPPLVRARRYGDVRGTDLSALDAVADALLVRTCAGLSVAVTSLDDDGAVQLREALDAVHEAVALRDDAPSRERWLGTLRALIPRADVHGLLVGRMVRLLLDAGELDTAAAGERLSRALSVGSTPALKASWVEGFLAGSGLLLVHDHTLLALIDEWLRELADDDFTEVVPLLRRTFGQFQSVERRSIGDRAKNLGTPGTGAVDTAEHPGWDRERAQPAIDRAAWLLGLSGVATTANPQEAP